MWHWIILIYVAWFDSEKNPLVLRISENAKPRFETSTLDNNIKCFCFCALNCYLIPEREKSRTKHTSLSFETHDLFAICYHKVTYSHFNWFFFSTFTMCILSKHSIYSAGINSDELAKRSNHYFDVLIFTQRWPITDCITWMGGGDDHVCTLPSQKDTWIIHGVWPTKFGTLGPFFCNASQPFDLNTLKPLLDQMRQYWTNIRKGRKHYIFT